MSRTRTRSNAQTRELDAYIRMQVVSGRLASASDVVRTALGLMVAREATFPGLGSLTGQAESARVIEEPTP